MTPEMTTAAPKLETMGGTSSSSSYLVFGYLTDDAGKTVARVGLRPMLDDLYATEVSALFRMRVAAGDGMPFGTLDEVWPKVAPKFVAAMDSAPDASPVEADRFAVPQMSTVRLSMVRHLRTHRSDDDSKPYGFLANLVDTIVSEAFAIADCSDDLREPLRAELLAGLLAQYDSRFSTNYAEQVQAAQSPETADSSDEGAGTPDATAEIDAMLDEKNDADEADEADEADPTGKANATPDDHPEADEPQETNFGEVEGTHPGVQPPVGKKQNPDGSLHDSGEDTEDATEPDLHDGDEGGKDTVKKD